MHASRNKQFLLVDAKAPFIETYHFAFEAAVNAAPPLLALSIAPELVDMTDAEAPQEIILALQHYPQHIEKMLYALQFDFQVKADVDVFLPEEEWKMKPKYLKWFRAMGGLAVMPFFAKDPDVRLYMLAGDYLKSGKSPIEKMTNDAGRVKYLVRGGAVRELSKRLFECCLGFMVYCHGAGFDPKYAVASMLASFSLPVHYADLHKQYRKRVMHPGGANSNHDAGHRFRAA